MPGQQPLDSDHGSGLVKGGGEVNYGRPGAQPVLPGSLGTQQLDPLNAGGSSHLP